MTRTKKLAPVVKHVDKKQQTALQAVAFSQQQLKNQTDRLQQLKHYKLEYASQHTSGSQLSYSAVQFQEYNRFLAQLDETIEKQNQVVEMAVREVEIKRQNWQITRSRSDAMHKVVDRLQESEQQLEAKTEQKFMDEVALRTSQKTS